MPDNEIDLSPIDSDRIVWTGPSVPASAFQPNTVRQHNIILYDDPMIDTDAANKAYVDAADVGVASQIITNHAALTGIGVTTHPSIDSSLAATATSLNTGWAPVTDLTLTFNQNFAPVYQCTIPGDVTSRFSPGMRIRVTHAGVTKYFILVAVAYSGAFQLTNMYLYGGTDYTLAAGAITDFCFSTAKTPNGFPASPLKWTVRVTYSVSRYVATPTANRWYNSSTSPDVATFGTINMPYGLWRVSYQYSLNVQTLAAQTNWSLGATLSTTQGTGGTTGETDAEFTSCIGGAGASSLNQSIGTIGRSKIVAQTAQEWVRPYYINLRTTHANMDRIGVIPEFHGRSVLEAECAYV